MSVSSRVGKSLTPKLIDRIPGLTDGFVREALKRAIQGVGPLTGAAEAADVQLAEQRGDVNKAIHEVIENHVRYAGLQGFATNLGGLVTATVTIPANITGLALIQCRMVAGIAHLRGYDLTDPNVRNAILIAVLGEESVNKLVKKKKLPAPPMAVATAPVHDAHLDKIISAEVATELVTRVAGKKLATTIGRRVPVVGGLVGAGADGDGTRKIGRNPDRELRPPARR
jgi:hypothetical protein